MSVGSPLRPCSWILAACVAASVMSTAQGGGTEKKEQKAADKLAAQDRTLNTVAQKGIPLNVTTNVADAASVEAVLIPASLARRICGKEVANNYAVIELTISNKDPNAALVVESIFLDYSQWLLSGLPQTKPSIPTLDKNQIPNKPWQVASVESRLVRGELLDAQQWTARNWTIRALTAIGSVAAGFQFPFSADFSRGVAAFNGSVVPGAATLWPDGTVNQINRISDFGFQTNTVIPKQSANILIAFFPIDRFLTPTFRQLFLQNPASFFVPGELLIDPKTSKTMIDLLLPTARAVKPDIDETTLAPVLIKTFLADCSNPSSSSQEECRLQNVFNRASLNSVRLVVGGVMTVAVATVPATIYGVEFDAGNSNKDVWTKPNTPQKGKITGLYLSSGVPSVVDASGRSIDGVSIEKNDADSNDNELAFTMTVTKCIPPDTAIFFVVNKAAEAAGNSDGSGASHMAAGTPNATDGKTLLGNKTQSAKEASPAVASTPFQFTLPIYVCPSEGQGDDMQGSSPARVKPGGSAESGAASHQTEPSNPAAVGPKSAEQKRQ